MIEVKVADSSCRDLIWPITRGPNATGLSLTIQYPDWKSSILNLDPYVPQIWTYLKIKAGPSCIGPLHQHSKTRQSIDA